MLECSGKLQRKVFVLSFFIVFILTGFAITQGQTSSENKSRPISRLVLPSTKKENTTKESKSAHASSSESKPIEKIPAAAFTPMPEEKTILDLINKERQKMNLAPLRLDPKLCLFARSYSENMAKKNYLNHVSPEGKTMKDRVREAGLTGWKAVGENIAYNQGYDDPAAFAVERWMISKGHKANLLGAFWTETGIGVAKSSDGTFYFTQIFIAR